MGGLDRSGGCLCGAVRFTAKDLRRDYGACHCEMCRRWTGSVFLGITVPEGDLTWEGSENIRRYQSSAWAERAWCDRCGSNLWYAVTAEGPHKGNLEVPLGLFDDPNGFELQREIYVDIAPDSFAIAGDRQKMTASEVRQIFGMETAP